MLINCAAYQEGRKLADIGVDDISAYLAKPDCFVWVALKDPGPDELEDRIFEKANTAAARAIIEDMYTLKRRLLVLQHASTPLLDAVAKLYGSRVPQLCGGMQDYFRDVYDHLQRIVKSVEARREMVTTAIQVNLGMISLAESETTKRLGAFAALFAVPTMIAGIYGMNFQSIPELHWHYGYPACLAAMLVIDVFLWWRFKKVGWL